MCAEGAPQSMPETAMPSAPLPMPMPGDLFNEEDENESAPPAIMTPPAAPPMAH